MKLCKFEHTGGTTYLFRCPGCNRDHAFSVKSDGTGWTFDGNMERPTVSPSLLVHPHDGDPPQRRCHLFVENGRIRFLDDCDHALRATTVDMEDRPAADD